MQKFGTLKTLAKQQLDSWALNFRNECLFIFERHFDDGYCETFGKLCFNLVLCSGISTTCMFLQTGKSCWCTLCICMADTTWMEARGGEKEAIRMEAAQDVELAANIMCI